MTILCIPGNIVNAKSYPFWDQFYAIVQSKGYAHTVLTGMLPEEEIIGLINVHDTWVSIDSFVPHLAAYRKLKRGVVIWGKSDPKIFGYEHNINLLKHPKYLRPQQFMWWANPDGSWKEPNNPDAFVSPEVVLEAVERAY